MMASSSRSMIARPIDGDGVENGENNINNKQYLEKSHGTGNWLPSWALCNALARMQQTHVTEDPRLKGKTPTLTAAHVLRFV